MQNKRRKLYKTNSHLVLLLVVSLLIFSTLVTASVFFLSPGIESEIRQRVVESIEEKKVVGLEVNVSGRDVTIKGRVESKQVSNSIETIARRIEGVREINSLLVIKNLSSEQ